MKETIDNIEKSFIYSKQSQTKLEMKTIQIESEFKGLKNKIENEVSDILKESKEFYLASFNQHKLDKMSILKLIKIN